MKILNVMKTIFFTETKRGNQRNITFCVIHKALLHMIQFFAKSSLLHLIHQLLIFCDSLILPKCLVLTLFLLIELKQRIFMFMLIKTLILVNMIK